MMQFIGTLVVLATFIIIGFCQLFLGNGHNSYASHVIKKDGTDA